jgi:hypothetical protein
MSIRYSRSGIVELSSGLATHRGRRFEMLRLGSEEFLVARRAWVLYFRCSIGD